MSGHVEITGKGPPSPAAIHHVLMQEGDRAMNRALLVIVAEVRRTIAKRTGDTARRVLPQTQIVGNSIIGTIVATQVARWLEEGTGLYGPRRQVIRPKNAQALRFPAGPAGFTLAGRQRAGRAGASARWVYAKFVRGIKPRHYIRNAAESTRAAQDAEFDAGAGRAAARIARLGGAR